MLPPPTFGPISCIGSKFTQMSTHPRASFACLMKGSEKHVLERAPILLFGRLVRCSAHGRSFATTVRAIGASLSEPHTSELNGGLLGALWGERERIVGASLVLH